MRERDLSCIVLQDIRKRSLQYSGPSALVGKARGMFAQLRTATSGLDADQLDFLIAEKFVEDSDGVRSPADTGDHCRGQFALCLPDLLPGFARDHAMEIAHHRRIWVGTQH